MTATEGAAARPHAVVMPWPGQGHINPLLHLSKRLASQGFLITFVNTDYSHTRVTQSLQRQEEEGRSTAAATAGEEKPEISFVALPDGVSAQDTRTCDVPEISRGVVRTAAAFEELLRILEPPPTCIISDTYVMHTQDAANKFGIPRVSFWTQSAACYAAHFAVSKGVVTMLSGFLQCCDGSDFMFDFCVRPFLRQSEASCVIFNSFEDLEGEVVNGLRQQDPECNFHGIGPVLPLEYFSGGKLSHVPSNNALAYFPEDFDCLKWLDTQEKATVLYISFGSLTELTGSELEEFALGLEASGLPLLWVLRPDVLEGGGPAALPAGFEERTRERARIISWAPQLHVLAHPSVGAFLTHAGWNSTLEGIVQGLPLLGFPYFADQMINCRFIQDVWANGLTFDRHTGGGPLTRSLVEKKAKAVMGDAKLREKAVQLRDSARRAVTSHQGSSTTALHKIVRALRTH